MLHGVLLTLFWIVWGRLASCAHASRVNKHKPWMESSYHGVITENTDTVLLDPPLMALDKDAPAPYAGEICAFKVHSGGPASPLFEAVVVNATSGEGLLRAWGLVDCEEQREHTLTVQAYDCGTGPNATDWKKSHKAVVHIQVDDVNEFAPVFRQTQYKASVTEGKIYEAILQVEAWDEDCSPQYSQICNYDIVTAGTPFAIDRNGNIRNTERLSHDKRHSYHFLVTAVDCGQRRANESVSVHIDVEPACTPGWKGWSERVDYEPGSGSMRLFPSMHLEICGGAVSSVSATLQLRATHNPKECDHAHRSLHKRCGAAAVDGTDLLPAPGPSSDWTASLATGGSRNGEAVFRFDGRQAALVPERVAPRHPGDRFTIATWMRHAPNPSPGSPAHNNETLICSADKSEMNRRHYSLYVHDCQLVFLLRTDSSQSAQFHWKLHQICDREWHYYILNVELPTVTLLVDAVTFEPYLVTGGPSTQHVSLEADTRLTVGACWQGGETETPRFTQYFKGSLSGLTVGPGGMETQRLISCLQACKEALDIINPLESWAQDVTVHLNPAQSVLVLGSADVHSLSAVMSRVSYINPLLVPSPGPRTLTISTALQCFGEDSCVSVPDVSVVVRVLPPSGPSGNSAPRSHHRLARPALPPGQPRITIAGSHRLVRPAWDLRGPAGVAPFREVHITSSTAAVSRGDASPFSAAPRSGVMEVMLNLDYCDVVVMGEELNPERESLDIAHNALLGKHLDATNSTSGISIYGVDSMLHYEQAVRQVRYRNWRPAALSVRKFRLTCSELNGRYTSNEFNMEVSVLHHTAPVEHVNHMAVQSQYLRPVHHPVVIHTLSSHMPGGAVSPSVTVLIVLCVSGVVLLVVMGVYRIHSSAQHQDASTQHKDPSALTITVNPMENTGGSQALGGAVREPACTEEEEEPTGDVWSDQSSDSEEEEEEEEEEAQEEHMERKRNATDAPL